MFYEGEKANFETLNQATLNGDVCIMECKDKKTGERVPVVCAVNRLANGEMEFAPLAKLFTGNPYDEVEPPK